MGCGVWGQIQETTSAATVTHGMVHRPCAHRGQDRCDGSDPQGLLPALESFLPGEACCIPGEVAATRTRRSLLGMHRDRCLRRAVSSWTFVIDRKSTRLNSSHLVISYAVFCLKKNNRQRSLYGA